MLLHSIIKHADPCCDVPIEEHSIEETDNVNLENFDMSDVNNQTDDNPVEALKTSVINVEMDQNPQVHKFQKMLNMGVPRQAVLNKMILEGIDSKLLP